jgi:hypothetical protein
LKKKFLNGATVLIEGIVQLNAYKVLAQFEEGSKHLTLDS